MATCKECVHHRICNRIDHEIEYSDKSVREAEEQLAIKCRFFKNKTDVVLVVRCSQCRKRYTTECALWFSQLDDKQYFCGAIHNDDFYCSYGERK